MVEYCLPKSLAIGRQLMASLLLLYEDTLSGRDEPSFQIKGRGVREHVKHHVLYHLGFVIFS